MASSCSLCLAGKTTFSFLREKTFLKGNLGVDLKPEASSLSSESIVEVMPITLGDKDLPVEEGGDGSPDFSSLHLGHSAFPLLLSLIHFPLGFHFV